jgi:DNA invertase Pin-like site-specific DNA recombinase
MSTDVQLKGDSLRRQLEASQEYAVKNNLNLVDSIQDIGISAFQGKNAKEGGLKVFLQALESNEVQKGSVLIVESLDRISRSQVLTAFNLFAQILSSGIEIVTLADKQKYTEESISNNPGQLFTSLGIMLRANEESEIKSKRLKAAWSNKRKNAENEKLTERCPAWLKLSSDRKRFKIVEEKGKVVRQIFDMSISGDGIFNIARKLNEDNIPTFGRSKFWQKSYISKILHNKAVYGYFQPKKYDNGIAIPDGLAVDNYYPETVSKEKYLLAQSLLNQRRNNGGGRQGKNFNNIFTKLIKCKKCKSTFLFRDKGKPPKGAAYLICNNADSNGGCQSTSWRYDRFLNLFFEYVKEINLEKIVKSESHDKKIFEIQNKKAIESEKLEECRKKISTLLNRIEDPEVPEGVLSTLYKRLQENQLEELSLLDSINSAEIELARLDDKVDSRDIKAIKEVCKTLYSSNNSLNNPEKRKEIHNCLKRLIKAIYLSTDTSLYHPEEAIELLLEQDKDALKKKGIVTHEELMDFFQTMEGQEFMQIKNRSVEVHFHSGVVRVISPAYMSTYYKRSPRMVQYLKSRSNPA